ncbi:hypothetical protein GJ654_13600 [Rhodoblastus acidophilus]|uniref:SGNH hydrolase-type esterase domain-containing protein n=1 Tax=Rhodoblastus acidophilus TaxID=1074 RepID=A0A6N8DN53_RHOAC|nr:SGNH/GDSL hydrolase family protein [Rhodoblastus acidophilus]MCW2275420.1 hypothetical protein [Rhodoblastus acidophilus]MTV32022.1 hypothetical protein [Rhodoblastus acidophilus]
MRWRLVLLGLVCAAALGGVFQVGRDAWIARKLAHLDGFDPAVIKCFDAEPASEAQRPRIYLVGDSAAEEWPRQNFDARYEAVDCGMTGETTAQLVSRFDRFDFLRPGDVVVLTSGVYDAVGAAFAPPERMDDISARAAERLVRLAREARDHGGRVMMLTITPPFQPELLRRPFWRESIRDFTQKANAALRSSDLTGVELIDVARLLGGDDRRTPDIWGRNGLKLNAEAFGVLTAEINRRLAEDGGRR